jgi:hypothetical protein
MKSRNPRHKFHPFHGVIGILSSITLTSLGQPFLLAQQTPQAQSQVMTTTSPAPEAAPKIPNDQLDSLVAPIALYPDPLLAQTLAASTYPLEVIQLQQWLQKNPNLKDKALEDAVAKQNWDPSIQGLAAVPEVVKQLADNIQWTTDLGNAFLDQQADVMAAVQRMRAKAQGNGNLKTTEQQTVETQTVDGGKQAIVIQQAKPDVVYVPSYNPTVVYGAAVYPYPPIAYPPPGYYAAGMAVSFGVGVALGAAWGGGWGYGCGWGHGDVNINVNNKYVNNYNKTNNINNANKNWQHNPQHRGGAPYGNRETANRYGGTAGRQPGRGTAANRPGGGAGTGNLGGANRPGGGNMGAGNRPGGGGGAGNRPGGGAGAGNRPGGGAGPGARPGGGAKPSTRPSGGGADRVGGRSPSRGGGGGGAFGGGMGGSSAKAASNRGSHSLGGGGRGSGGRGGGGQRGERHRGGGGRRR